MSQPNEESTPGTSSTPPQTPVVTPDGAGKDAASERDEASLPQWARDELKSVRDEAAAKRVANRELSEKLGKAKSPEEFAATIAEYEAKLQKVELQSARNAAGLKHGLPDALVALLQGTTAEELETHAKTLAELVKPAAPGRKDARLAGGLDGRGGGGAEKYDPKKLADEIEAQSRSIF